MVSASVSPFISFSFPKNSFIFLYLLFFASVSMPSPASFLFLRSLFLFSSLGLLWSGRHCAGGSTTCGRGTGRGCGLGATGCFRTGRSGVKITRENATDYLCNIISTFSMKTQRRLRELFSFVYVIVFWGDNYRNGVFFNFNLFAR